jgi:hypothetical protein
VASTLLTQRADAVHLELNVDAKGLYDTLFTLHESRDYRLRPTVSRIRDSFDSHELQVLRWIPGATNLADALKRNLDMYAKLNQVAISGSLPHVLSSDCAEVDSRYWK